MDNPASTTVVLEDTARRERAKERLYVTFQFGGWGFLLVLQILLLLYFGGKEVHQDLLVAIANEVMTIAMAMLLAHYARPFIHRRGWKQLGWRPLIPRVIATAAVLSLIWCAAAYGVVYGLLQQPWPTEKYSMPALFAVSWVQGTSLFTGWLCLYFFYHLFDRFNRSEIERLRLSTHVKEAELRALKSQVNPHFIFNSLNSLRALIEENPPRAREAVTQLANLLRYSLQSGQSETVPFEEELRIANDYLALEQVRHEERLRVRLDVAEDTLSLPIPPLLLQTLVENAVKYGISRRPEGGEIAIIARRENDSLRLQVTNPGELTGDVAAPPSVSTGMGLRNAAERLRLLFGERASLQLRAAAPALVIAEAIVPCNLANA
ncbi:sensor histidine kinase [Opitutus terrae]|uniref:Signal transduction histidine kinase, LytS n=1 Tax=Opitutus terrae (strain DSM 11246 / JCM 15787 / PB90-1) TaxID=452637 RepID=B1ZSQ9_OPITP|nr:histidine kinase [Opitutus terrae]ACB74810.1 signal transduction histidine kinase, LytS [Opitutus terrae PB90-1]